MRFDVSPSGVGGESGLLPPALCTEVHRITWQEGREGPSAVHLPAAVVHPNRHVKKTSVLSGRGSKGHGVYADAVIHRSTATPLPLVLTLSLSR